MKKIGIFGGTFNPIHIGHLIIASFIQMEMGLDEIVFMPAGDQPLKDNEIHFDCRLDMVKLSIEGDDRFSYTDIENHGGKSYTYNTLEKIKKSSKDDIYFIMGADSLDSIKKWYKYEDLLRENKIIATARPGSRNLDDIKKELGSLADSVTLIEGPLVDISSTMVRDLAHEGKTIKYLVREKVEKYINDNGLYKDK